MKCFPNERQLYLLESVWSCPQTRRNIQNPRYDQKPLVEECQYMSIKKPPTTKFYLLELDTPGKTTWVMSIDLFHRNVLDIYILFYRIFQQLVGGAIALPGIITITVVVHITPGIRENT